MIYYLFTLTKNGEVFRGLNAEEVCRHINNKDNAELKRVVLKWMCDTSQTFLFFKGNYQLERLK
jgi:hypothetical protein